MTKKLDDEILALARTVGEKLARRNLMCATAESCTGGLIGHLIEESRQPTGRELWRRVDDEASAHMKGRFSGE